jgi:YegS/Rv2252/BmrU family lipid kinase
MARGAIVIVNRKSRYTESELSEGLELLKDRGIDIVGRIMTSGPGEVTRALERYKGLIDRVILGGGDGTMNHAAPSLIRAGCTLGILPTGTANDLARTLGIPLSVEAAFRIIADGNVRRIDLGRVNGRFFFNVAHIGLGAEVTRLVSRESKDRWGPLAYMRNLLSAVTRRGAFRVYIHWDGERRSFRAIEVAVGNGRHYAGGMTIYENAGIEDGLLHVYVVKPRSVWRMAIGFPAFRKGKSEKEWIRYMAGERMVVRTRRPLPVAVDGELVTKTPARFEVLPGALPVFVPADRSGAERGAG